MTTTVAIDSKIKQVVSNIRNLPTPPQVFHQIQKVINDPKASAVHIAAILAEDPAMSVKVLKLTNSAFYGLAREIESVKQAVVIVGMEAIKNLVLSASVLDMFKADHIDHDYQEQFWRHSLATAFGGRVMARKVKARGMVDPDSAFSAGLLHDVGKMVISCFLKGEYEKFKATRESDQSRPDYPVELEALGYSHAHVGAFLSTHWKLPQKLGEAIQFHHEPMTSESQDPLIMLIHLADHVAKRTFYDRADAHLIGEPDPEVLAHLELTPDDMEGFCDSLREEYVKAETFMQMVGLG